VTRQLPSLQEAARIFAVKRTRPFPRVPPAAGRALTSTIKALDARFGHGADGLGARWSEIVGAALARRTQPTRISKLRAGGGAALELKVEGPSAAIVQHQAPDILARVNLFLGAGSIERLRIVQGPLRALARSPAAPPPRPRPKAPLDAAAEQDLAHSVAHLPDGRLKRALVRLGREILRDERG
jgi:hypothetical protein